MVISRLGGLAAALAAAVLIAGVAGLVGGRARWTPWLAVLFGFNARYRVSSREALRGVKAIDLALLVLAAAAYAGFWPGPGASHVVWMALAVAQPLLGIPLLVATRLSGRSGLMGGALVLSVLMLVDGTRPEVAWLGVVATVLLLVGDFGTRARPSPPLAGVLAAGYAALVAWFCFLAPLLLG